MSNWNMNKVGTAVAGVFRDFVGLPAQVLAAQGHGNLFQSVDDRHATQFAKMIQTYPWEALTRAHYDKVVWRKKIVMRKAQVLELIQDNQLLVPGKVQGFTIQWKYSAVPTEREWNMRNDMALVHCDYRISPCIPHGGRAVVLSWS